MQRTQRQFDPGEQFAELLTETESALIEVMAKIERLVWLKGKIAEEMTAMRDTADTLETFTEADAGMIFKLHDEPQKAERAFADLRRRYNFPFCRFGREVRYTREQLREIVAILEMNGKSRKALHATPLKRAA